MRLPVSLCVAEPSVQLKLLSGFTVVAIPSTEDIMACPEASWWTSGKHGNLSPIEQANVWALIHVSKQHDVQLSDADVALAVTKVGGGHPGKQAIRKYRFSFENDAFWYL